MATTDLPDGQSALVTGASRGIGEATAHALASSGADVALVARSGDELAAVAALSNRLTTFERLTSRRTSAHGAVWNWTHTLSETQADPPTFTRAKLSCSTSERSRSEDGGAVAGRR